jgi:sodium transport system permease protein
MLTNILTVFQKELQDSLRDRRTLFGALFYPLLGPLLMVLLLSVVMRLFNDQSERPLELAVSGAENAPTLIAYLEANQVQVQPSPADPQAEVRANNLDVVLVVPADFQTRLAAEQPAPVQLVYDGSRQTASVAIRRTQRLLEAFSAELAAQRLAARGLDPQVIAALAVEELDLATPQSQAASFLNILPYFMIFSIFMGGMGVTIEATAGERERGSLEPLLINPVTAAELVLGKLGVSLVFTAQAVVETVLGFGLMINLLPTSDLGLQLSVSPASLLAIFLVTMPIALLAAALQFIIATSTRNYREAQNYLGLLPLIPALPGMFLAFLPLKAELWAMLIPTFGQQLLINQLMRGEAVNGLHVVVASLVTLLVGSALVWVATRLFGREQMLFAK